MAMTKVKICGVTNLKDANLVASLGADYLGLNLYKESPRKVSVKMAKDIIATLPPFITPVAVFVDEEITEAGKILKKCGFKIVQLHGNESVEYCMQLKTVVNVPTIKAFRILDDSSLSLMEDYKDAVDYFLLDAYVAGEPGGTGETFNWDLALKAKEFNKPVFLAGGLNPENVLDAIEKVQPFCVDSASGVERLPTKKDYDKLKDFIRKAHGF